MPNENMNRGDSTDDPDDLLKNSSEANIEPEPRDSDEKLTPDDLIEADHLDDLDLLDDEEDEDGEGDDEDDFEDDEGSADHDWEEDDQWRRSADARLNILPDDLDEGEIEEIEELHADLGENTRTILITGASGNIAMKLREAWEDLYDLILIDSVADPDDPDVIQADLSVWDQEWVDLFAEVDTVIHLAGNRNEFSTWQDLADPNLDGYANVLNAAILNEVERFIFASSNHVMGGYREIDDLPITTDLPPRPDSPYGGTKLMGERLGKSAAEAYGLTFIGLRLGWIQDGDNIPQTLPDEWNRQLWLSNEDALQLFECAVEADLENCHYLIVNGMSNNSGMRWDLSSTNEWLGYQPEDDAFAVLDDASDV